jgi:hypothetical protein
MKQLIVTQIHAPFSVFIGQKDYGERRRKPSLTNAYLPERRSLTDWAACEGCAICVKIAQK